ncbi:MAG: CapA family protein [Myxococcales bacterium]|nr:CapA family protein [Myxococcales bacterium]
MTDGFSIVAMGDVMLARDVEAHFRRAPDDFAMAEIRSRLARYDLVLVNLENPVGTRGAPHPKQDPHVAFRSHPDTLDVLENLGTQVVTLANNHPLDYGPETLVDTLDHLDARGIRHVGAGRNYEEANQPLLLRLGGQDVALLAYVFIYSASTERATRTSPGVSDYRIDKILARIRSLAKAGRQVVVTIHWGHEYSFYPLPYQMKQARRMIDAGARLIIGHGPHYLQGIERYRGGEIVYSMGNFVFDEPYPFAKRGFIYGARVTPETIERELLPYVIRQHVPQLATGAEERRLRSYVDALSQGYPRKSDRFWANRNNDYLNDIIKRVVRMKSTKFVFLPPLSFYTSMGPRKLLEKAQRGARLLGRRLAERVG